MDTESFKIFINELDDIFDDLTYELGIDATELVALSDGIEEFYKKNSMLLDDVDDTPDWYHIKLQERLDAEAQGE